MFLIVGLFALVLTSLRLVWIDYHAVPKHPQVIAGVLDLTNWDLPKDRTITLDGDWTFYPYTFIDPIRDHTSIASQQKTYLKVPGQWDAAFPKTNSTKVEYGSYQLKIKLKSLSQKPYGFRIQRIELASKLFVNGELIAHAGVPSEQSSQQITRVLPYIASFIPKTS